LETERIPLSFHLNHARKHWEFWAVVASIFIVYKGLTSARFESSVITNYLIKQTQCKNWRVFLSQHLSLIVSSRECWICPTLWGSQLRCPARSVSLLMTLILPSPWVALR
jgi:hypothetical protein